MKLKQWLSAALFSLFAISMNALADEANIKKLVEKAYPKLTVSSVTETQFSGLYEVFAGGQILYTDKDFNFLIVEGNLVDPKTRKNLTEARMQDLNRIDFKSLPLNKAIKVVKGNGKRKLVVFSDVDCPFCKRLEKNELTNIDDVTIYTFLYPIEQLHPDAANKSKSIWCAPDRVKAWNGWIFDDKLPKKAGQCDVPLEEIGALARKYGVYSTPTLFFEDGKRLLGAQPYKQIEKFLKAASK